jgi:hypothetical protein
MTMVYNPARPWTAVPGSKWYLTVTVVALVLLTSVALPGAQATSYKEEAIIAPGGHLVLMNLTVSPIPMNGDMGELGSLRYLIHLLSDSGQDRYDVLLMPRAHYTNYLSGQPFETVESASCLGAGEWPAYSYHLFTEEGDFTLLIDNSERAGPYTPAELKVRYEVVTTNLQVEADSQWEAFLALMLIVSLLGVSFLLILRIGLRHRLERTREQQGRRCPHCGKELPSFGSYCPYCGERR